MSELWGQTKSQRPCWKAWLCAFLLLPAFLPSLLPSATAAIQATVDRPVVTLGETLSLTLKIDGGQQVSQPDLPQIPNFNVTGSGGHSYIISNGVAHQSFSYELQPVQAGDLVIPAFAFSIGGQRSTTQPIHVKVLPPAAPAPGPPPAFVKIALGKTNLYVGEVVDLEVQVYYRDGRVTQYPQLPADPGFTLGKWAQPAQTRVAVSNLAYYYCAFRAPITALKAGALTVGPLTYPIAVPDRTRRSLFGFLENEVRVNAEQVRAIALPLPTANIPATFGGAVGQYAVTMTASPTTVAVGDPITVRIQIAGRGWLDSLSLPPQPKWSEFKMYAPNAKVEGADPNNVSGTKTFEVVLAPQNAAIKALPPFTFSYFDPQAGAYRTVSTPAVPLQVSASALAASLPPLTATNAPVQPAMSDIVHIRVRMGEVEGGSRILQARGKERAPGLQPWFMALQCIAPALWLGLVLRRKRAESLQNNPRLRRRREVEGRVKTALAELRLHAEAKRSDDFFATLFRILQEQIGERLNLPANSVTESVVDEHLRARGFGEEGCRRLHDLFQSANLARYAPVQASHEFDSLRANAEQTIRELQQWEAPL